MEPQGSKMEVKASQMEPKASQTGAKTSQGPPNGAPARQYRFLMPKGWAQTICLYAFGLNCWSKFRKNLYKQKHSNKKISIKEIFKQKSPEF